MARPPWHHMSPGDVPLFASFLLTDEAAPFTRWQFDVALGTGTDPGPGQTEEQRQMARQISKLRIDAVGWTQDEDAMIFEVKPEGRITAVGQLVTYRQFWLWEFGFEPQVALITDSMVPDIGRMLASINARIYIVKPASPGQVEAARRSIAQLPPPARARSRIPLGPPPPESIPPPLKIP